MIVEKNKGRKIQYKIQDGMIFIGDNELMINANKYQADYPVHIDVCRDKMGFLQMSPQIDGRYVMEIDIPARKYEKVHEEDFSEMRNTEYEQKAIPLNIEEVIITLWAVEKEEE